MITASHNPYKWNGVKFKASYGSSALPSIIAQIEQELAVVSRDGVPALPPRSDLIHALDPKAPYLDTIEKLVDWDRLRAAKLRFVADPMHGSASGLLRALCARNGVACDEIHGDARSALRRHPSRAHRAARGGRAPGRARGPIRRRPVRRWRWRPHRRDRPRRHVHHAAPDFRAAAVASRRHARSHRRRCENFFLNETHRQDRREIRPHGVRDPDRFQIHLRADARARHLTGRRRVRRHRHEALSSRARRHGDVPCCLRN